MNEQSTEYYIGLMSGTSLDGLDGALIAINKYKSGAWDINLISRAHSLLPTDLSHSLNQICISQDVTLSALGQCQVQLANLSAALVKQLLQQSEMKAEMITAIGSHGVTIGHYPLHAFPFTLQIGDASYLAELTGIDVICDFRMADIAAGGQGAPLVPPFHRAIMAENDDVVMLNLGGIANITVLKSGDEVTGYDTGPANTLLNLWCQQHLGTPYDDKGKWASSGKLNRVLLDSLMEESFFTLSPPKSCGRELFHLNWLNKHLAEFNIEIAVEDVQCTLTHLTAKSVANEIKKQGKIKKVFVCGGGAHNEFLMDTLAGYLSDISVASTQELGVDPDYMEAMAFAWLAHQRVHGLTANLPSVTGALKHKVLGAWYHK